MKGITEVEVALDEMRMLQGLVRKKASTERKEIYQCKQKYDLIRMEKKLQTEPFRSELVRNHFTVTLMGTLSGCGIIVFCSSKELLYFTLQKSKDKLLMMPKFLAKYIEKKMI